MTKQLSIGAVILVFVAVGAWWQWGRQAATEPYTFPVASEDVIASWNYAGAYSGNAELEAKGKANIQRLSELFGKEGDTFTDYELYVSVANEYDLLGDGKGTYDYLLKALTIDAEKTGLAWHNMGVLMAKLGALNSARIAYDRMVKAQPHIINYHSARIEFLKTYMPEDTAAIAAAEDARAQITGEYIFE